MDHTYVVTVLTIFLIHPIFSTAKESWKMKYDYIIVGGGTAGCVLANRLTENPHLSVLVIEAGKNIFNDTVVSIPRSWLNILNDLPEFMWGYHGYLSEPVPGLNNRKLKMAAAKMLGGACSWKELGNNGWGYEDILPYFKKSEQVLENDLASNGFRGTHGPWKTRFVHKHDIQNTFIKAAEELGFMKTDDINGHSQTEIGIAQLNVDNAGRRSSTAEAYLKPVLGRSNLDLVTEAHVTKIIIKRNKTTGVRFIKERMTFSVKATTEVILSAGALNSPQILMLSGIGPTMHLQEHGIEVIADLPVENNLKDHLDLRKLNFMSNLTNSKTFTPNYKEKGFWSNSGSQTIGFFSSSTQPSDSKVPYIELIMGLVLPSLPLPILNYIRNGSTIPDHLFDQFAKSEGDKATFFISPVLMHPRNNSGAVRLRSKDPKDQPILTINHLQNDDDVSDMLGAIRLIQQFIKTNAMKSIAAELATKPDPDCVHHGYDTNKYWICHIRNSVTAAQHHTSTCAMGPDGVVDSNLRVKGIKKLRIVDLSVIPDYITGHTMAATIMIAEKAANIIKVENGHQQELNSKPEQGVCLNDKTKKNSIGH